MNDGKAPGWRVKTIQYHDYWGDGGTLTVTFSDGRKQEIKLDLSPLKAAKFIEMLSDDIVAASKDLSEGILSGTIIKANNVNT